MVPVELRDGWFVVNGVKVPPLCGEFHFWRNNVLYWPRIFGEIKRMGLKHIASYVHWDFHELEPGKFDFTGATNPQRDLVGFLEACKKEGVYLNIRPGPYIYAETEFLGLPERVFQLHRLHPDYLKEAQKYIEAVSQAIAPFQATRGGPVFVVQVDNESSALTGPGQGRILQQVLEGGPEDQGSWQNFLKRQFGDLSTVSERYGSNYDEWDEVEPVILPRHFKDLQCFLDVAHFLEWYNAEYFRILSVMYRKAGLDVPFYTNSTGPPFPHDPALNKHAIDLLATDLYYLKPETHLNMVALNGLLLAATQPLVLAAEFRCGTSEAFNAQDHRLQALTSMVYGFHGWNWFMLVKRERWAPGPIDEDGRTTNLFPVLEEITRHYNDLSWPDFQRVTNVALIWDRQDAFLDKVAPMEPMFDIHYDSTFNATFKALVKGSIPISFHYPREGGRTSLAGKDAVIYAGRDIWDEKYAREFREYIDTGGVGVFVLNGPVKDKAGNKLESFADILAPARGIHRHSGGLPAAFNDARDGQTISLTTKVYADYDTSTIQLGDLRELWFKGMTIGYMGRLGKGQIIRLGCELTATALVALLQEAGVMLPYTGASRHIQAGVFHNPDTGIIAIPHINITENPAGCRLKLQPGKLGIDVDRAYQCRYLFGKTTRVLDKAFQVPLKLDARDGDIIVIEPQ